MPNVSLCEDAPTTVHYNPYVPQHDYSQDYLTFVALSQGTITINYDEADGSPTTISYSTDDGTTWTQITTTTEPYTITTLNVGDKLLLKGNNSSYYYSALIRGTATFEVCGNIMSLIYGDNFVGQTTLTESGTFDSFFYDNINLISAENLVLPATMLANSCYQTMFINCTSLTTAPELPATTLANYCYNSMFKGCTSLTTAPELPATTLASNCYSNMFSGCTSLTTAPELPATTLASYCYESMFNGCTSLNSITCLATNISASYCTSNWVSGVAASGTFTKAASMTLWTTGVNSVPSGWTVQDA